jgi:UDP-N-acetylglucosamine 2-epimerase (non-hydrolysing)
VHRRDSFGAPLARICEAIATLHDQHPELEILWPVHPNPAVKPVVLRSLGGRPRVHLAPPLGYGAFVAAMKRACFVLTDSGGVQEEAPALGKPVLVLRNESERPEAIEMGVAKLVGQDPEVIIRECSRLLTDSRAYRSMARGASPYGDGQAAPRIVLAIRRFLQDEQTPRGAVSRSA